MKDTKKLYESIMSHVAKEVKKAINEDYRNDYSTTSEEYEEEGMDVQGDCQEWCDAIHDFLYDNLDSEHTLPLYVTLQAVHQLHNEEVRGIAEAIMLYVQKHGEFPNLPPFDEVFLEYITSTLINEDWADDWCADVAQEHMIDAYNLV